MYGRCLIVLLVFLAGSATAAVVQGTTQHDPGATAIDHCTTIDTPGHYHLDANLTSSGTCIRIADTSGVVLDGNDNAITVASDEGIAIDDAANVTVRNLTIRGDPFSGIDVRESNDITVHHLTVTGAHHSINIVASETIDLEDNAVTNGSGVGVRIEASREVIVRNNTVERHEAAGIRPHANSSNILIDNNDFTDPGIAVAVFEAHDVTVSENEANHVLYGIQARRAEGLVVRDNTIRNGELCVMDVSEESRDIRFRNNHAENTDGMQLGVNSTNITVRDNAFINVTSNAIDLNGPTTSNALVANNTIVNSTPTGIRLRNGYDVVVRNNAVTETNGDGILVNHDTVNVSVEHNVVTASTGNGITVWHRNRRTTVTNNTVRDAAQHGILLERPLDTDIAGNEIVAAGRDGLRVQNVTNSTLRDNTVRDAGTSAIRVWRNSIDTSVNRLTMSTGDAATTVSFDGRNVALEPVSADQLSTEPLAAGIDRYLAVEAAGPTPAIDLEVHYSNDDVQHVDEETLHVWMYDGTEWRRVESEVDTNRPSVRANLTEEHLSGQHVFGIFGDPASPEPTRTSPVESQDQAGFGVITSIVAIVSTTLGAFRFSRWTESDS